MIYKFLKYKHVTSALIFDSFTLEGKLFDRYLRYIDVNTM